MPFVVWNNSYEGAKVFCFLIGGFFLTLFWLYRILVKQQKVIFKKIDYYYLGWLSILLISSLFGVHPLESVIGGSYRHQGILFFLTLWLIYKTVELLNSKQKSFLSKGLGIAILVESVFVLLQYVLGKLYFGHALGTIGESNAVAGFLAMGFPFVYKNFSKTLFVIPIISILIAESRSGLLAFLPNLFPLIKNLGSRYKFALMIFIGIFTIVFIGFISIGKGGSPFENRSLIWKLGFGQIISKPILGFGAESGEIVFNKAFYRYGLPLDRLIIDRAHNLFLDVTMWSGIIGLVLFSLFLFERIKNIKKYSHKIAFISFLVYSMFQPLSIVHWLFAFLL